MSIPNNEHERRMAILRAALPYTNRSSRHAMEMLLQTDSLLSIARQSPSDLEACDIGTAPNPEEMLLHIQEFCTPREYDMVQMILNFMKADRLFRNYRDFMNNSVPHAEDGDVHTAAMQRGFNNPLSSLLQMVGGFNNPENSGKMLEFLMSQLSPEQKNMFDSLSFTVNSQNQKGESEDEGMDEK